MLWQLKHGEREKKVRDQCRLNKQELPDFIQNKPEIWLGLEFCWSAFWELTTCRQFGQGGEGPIPWDAVHWYAARHDVTGEDFDRLLFILRKLDLAYLENRSNSNKKSMSVGSKPKVGRKGSMKVGR